MGGGGLLIRSHAIFQIRNLRRETLASLSLNTPTFWALCEGWGGVGGVTVLSVHYEHYGACFDKGQSRTLPEELFEHSRTEVIQTLDKGTPRAGSQGPRGFPIPRRKCTRARAFGAQCRVVLLLRITKRRSFFRKQCPMAAEE